MTSPQNLGPSDCQLVADSIEKSLAGMGLSARCGSDLCKMVARAKWLARFNGLLEAIEAAGSDRALDAFLSVEQGTHIARALRLSASIPGLRGKVQHLCRNRLDRWAEHKDAVDGKSDHSQGIDYLFEIEVAGRLARSGLDVRFDEPDVTISHPTLGGVGIACKRPTRLVTVEKNVSKAAKQIGESALPCCILVSLDAALFGTVRQALTQDELRRAGDRELDAVCQNHASAILGAFAYGVSEVIFCSRFVALVSQPSSLCWTFRTHRVSNPHISGAAARFDLLNLLLK